MAPPGKGTSYRLSAVADELGVERSRRRSPRTCCTWLAPATRPPSVHRPPPTGGVAGRSAGRVAQRSAVGPVNSAPGVQPPRTTTAPPGPVVQPARSAGRPQPTSAGASLRRSEPAGGAVSARDRARDAARTHHAQHGDLPTVTELAAAADVSRGTAHAALKELRDDRPALHIVNASDQPDHQPNHQDRLTASTSHQSQLQHSTTDQHSNRPRPTTNCKTAKTADHTYASRSNGVAKRTNQTARVDLSSDGLRS